MSERETLAEAWIQSDRDAAIRAHIHETVNAIVPDYLQRMDVDEAARATYLRSWRIREMWRREGAAGVHIAFTGEGLVDRLRQLREAWQVMVYGRIYGRNAPSHTR